MSDESYWIERHTLASGRAKQAEQDRDLAREQRDGWIARAERAEAAVVAVDIQRANLADAVGRVTALADEWCAMDPYGEISFNDAADALLAALDSTTPPPSPEGEGAR